MNKFLVITAVFILLSGCAYFQAPRLQLVETQAQLVVDCKLLGTIAETANADRILTYFAHRAMVQKIRERAVALGATHIVWLHNTDDAATAQAYRCPAPVTSGARTEKIEE